MLEIKDLHVFYGAIHALKGISLTVQDGELVSMIGANGLGMEVLIAINRMESGRGLSAGLSIVIIAILLDRLPQSVIRKEESQ